MTACLQIKILSSHYGKQGRLWRFSFIAIDLALTTFSRDTGPSHEKSPVAGALPITWRRRRDSRAAWRRRSWASPAARPATGHRPVATLRFESRARTPHTRRAPSPGLCRSYGGGGGGIRTLVPREGVNGFRDRRIQPLCHPSVRVTRRPEGRRGTCWRRVRDLNPGCAFGAYTISNRAPSATRTTLREIA